MAITDEDLKRLKELIDVNYSGYPRASVQETIDFLRFKIDFLLARLKAAEKAYLLYRNDPIVRHTPEQVEAGLAWRKAEGK